MGFNSLLAKLGQRFSDNLAASDQTIRDGTDTMMDRVRMANPDKIGPRLPDEAMPAELAEGNMMANGVMGSVAPAAKFMRAAPLTQAETGAASYLNGLVEQGKQAPLVQQAQQGLSRAADFADRARLQRFEALKRKLGR